MIDLETKEEIYFKNIADAGKHLCNLGFENFDSVCASISSILNGKGKTLRKKYTFQKI